MMLITKARLSHLFVCLVLAACCFSLSGCQDLLGDEVLDSGVIYCSEGSPVAFNTKHDL
jgi:hypothetical protein